MTGDTRAPGAAEDVTEDRLLDGRLRLLQPRTGFRAGPDALFLAAACPARAGESVLDLGCGVGTAALALALRVGGLDPHGLERAPETATLARRNAALNAIALTVHDGDAAAPPPALKSRAFDHVIANPPFFPAGSTAAPDPARDAARREGAMRAGDWARAGLRRLRQGGRLTLIHAVEKLPELLGALEGRAGDIAVLPLAPREGRPARRIILTARKDRFGPFRLAAPLVLHAGPAHLADGDDYSDAARAILRDAAPLTV